jgi:hypothetical protein
MGLEVIRIDMNCRIPSGGVNGTRLEKVSFAGTRRAEHPVDFAFDLVPVFRLDSIQNLFLCPLYF